VSPSIEIDQEVYEQLKQRAEPFVDTPNSVLRRLLQLSPSGAGVQTDPVVSPGPRRSPPAPAAEKVVHPKIKRTKTKQPPKRQRAPRGSLLPEEEYDLPLLRTLEEHGGAASFKEAVAGVSEKLGDRLTDLDRAKLSSGAIRWESRLQFVRLRLVENGLMDKDSPRGVWAITDAGRELLSSRLSVVA
jgi:hypothetical protein